MEKKYIFSLDYGKSQDEILLFSDNKKNTDNNLSLAEISSQDGFIFIFNHLLNKVMKFNSYGNLISTYTTGDQYVLRTMCIDKDQNVYLAVSQSNGFWDSNSEAFLSDKVICFNRDGIISKIYIPEESAFPMITKIEAMDNGELAVFSKCIKGELVYWFSKDGKLLYKIFFSPGTLPEYGGKSIIFSIDNISASKFQKVLFLSVNCYSDNEDTDFYKTIVYQYDIEQQKFTDNYSIPTLYTNIDNEKFQVTYNLLGVQGLNNLFFISPSGKNKYNLLITTIGGKVLVNTELKAEEKEYCYENLGLGPDGIISALFAVKNKCNIYWWRTDKFIK